MKTSKKTMLLISVACLHLLGWAATPWLGEAPERMDWDSAVQYCAAQGASLPSIEQLQAEVVACKGLIEGEYFVQENEYNKPYQACMESKSWQGDFWSKSLPSESKTCAFDLYIKTGGVGCGSKTQSTLKVRCVRK